MAFRLLDFSSIQTGNRETPVVLNQLNVVLLHLILYLIYPATGWQILAYKFVYQNRGPST